VVRVVRARVGPAVSLKVARARALLMDVVARVTLKAIARMAGVMAQAAVMETVEVVKVMGEAAAMALIRAMVRTDKVLAEATAEARVVRVMAVEKGKVVVRGRVMVAVDKARAWVMALVAVMVMARADRVTDAVARTMARVVRAMAVDAARARGTARGNPISTVTATAVVTI
jgi:hypothetical protein